MRVATAEIPQQQEEAVQPQSDQMAQAPHQAQAAQGTTSAHSSVAHRCSRLVVVAVAHHQVERLVLVVLLLVVLAEPLRTVLLRLLILVEVGVGAQLMPRVMVVRVVQVSFMFVSVTTHKE
jgi:hypothetical protein